MKFVVLLFLGELPEPLEVSLPLLSLDPLVLKLRVYGVNVSLSLLEPVLQSPLCPRERPLEVERHHLCRGDGVVCPEVVGDSHRQLECLLIASVPEELVRLVDDVHGPVVGRVVVDGQVSRAPEVRVDLVEHLPVCPSPVEGLEAGLLCLVVEGAVVDDVCDVLDFVVRDVGCEREPSESCPVFLPVSESEVVPGQTVLRTTRDDVVYIYGADILNYTNG